MIPNFPKSMLDEHARWHHARHNVDIQRLPPGNGLDFLQFHRRFIGQALSWYASSGLDPRLVQPWLSVPEPIRQAPCYNRAAEARILFQPGSFATADELGRFIESSGIHGCIHQEGSVLFGMPDLNDFDLAPRFTEFYNIHGLIDRWYQNWEGQSRFMEGLSHWCGSFETDGEDEVLYYRIEDGSWWLGRAERPSVASGVAAGTAGGDNVRLEWAAVGVNGELGAIHDGRPFRVWDTDGDGRLEIIVADLEGATWMEGKIVDSRLRWIPIVLDPRGRPPGA